MMNHSAATAKRHYYESTARTFALVTFDDIVNYVFRYNYVTLELIQRMLVSFNLVGRFSVENIYNRARELRKGNNA